MKRNDILVFLLVPFLFFYGCLKQNESERVSSGKKDAGQAVETREMKPEEMKYEEIVESAREFSYGRDYGDAEKLLETAIEDEPDRMEAYGELAENYFYQEKYDEAVSAVDRGLEKFPGDKTLLKKKAKYLRVSKNHEQSAKIYNGLIDSGETDSFVISSLAGVYEDMNEYEKAADYHQLNKKHNPDETAVYSMAGDFRTRQARSAVEKQEKVENYIKAGGSYLDAYQRANPSEKFEDRPQHLLNAADSYKNAWEISQNPEYREKMVQIYAQYLKEFPGAQEAPKVKETLDSLR